MKINLLLFILLAAPPVLAQGIYTTTRNYYRQDPFHKPFAQFLNNLVGDPALTEKEIKKKTDSTLFFLQGTYTSHKPFFFPASRCKVILAEYQEYTDSTETETYNYFVYQLVGYAAPGDEGVRDIKEEFERLSKKVKRGLTEHNRRELKRGPVTTGMVVDYGYPYLVFDPLTIAWASSNEKKENIIALTVRFILRDNAAYLPIPADSP